MPLHAYAPALSADAGTVLLAVLACMAVITLIGSLIAPRAADAANDTVTGAGLAGGLLAVWGAAGLPVSWGAAALGFASLAGLVLAVRRRRLPGGPMMPVLVFLIPYLLIAASAPATMWDDFFHWLPNAAYVWRFDHLPLPGGPSSPSQWPSYPYTLPFVTASASWLAGRFLENAGAVANTVFLAAFGALLAEAAAQGRTRRWAPAAFGALFATTLNPSFNPNVLFTTYSDVATAVSVAAAAWIGARLLAMLERNPDADAGPLAWRFAFAATALLNLKQANLVLFVLLLGGLGLTVWRFDRARLARLARLAPAMLAPPLAVFVLWRVHVMRAPQAGEMSFRAFDTWNTDVVGTILSEMLRLALEVPLFHLLMLAVTGLGLAALRRPVGAGKRLCVAAAAAWIGYNLFLFLVYLGAMTRAEASSAADYWRYAPHLGLLGLLAAVVRLAEVVRFGGAARAAWLAIPAAIALLVPAAAWVSPWNKAWPVHYRAVGREAAALLPDGARVALHGGHPSDPFGVALRFDLSGQAWPKDRDTRARIVWHGEDLPKVMEEIRAGTLTHVLLTDRVWPMDWAVRDLGISPLHRETALFAWRGDGWEKLRSWPLPEGVR
jgi:hypothetical protein